ncbi:hypothetical protein HPB50_000316 [Hyalomma asiaticum]|uniref:Uncharacterized protein n=1 Tax=Hyalomma asiaticum TaxID=266040 RepID=A0ACB7RTC8_HYAAI|nr:hypothetical protein HPB50_000316 [Hyalomma asiaticum]
MKMTLQSRLVSNRDQLVCIQDQKARKWDKMVSTTSKPENGHQLVCGWDQTNRKWDLLACNGNQLVSKRHQSQ